MSTPIGKVEVQQKKIFKRDDPISVGPNLLSLVLYKYFNLLVLITISSVAVIDILQEPCPCQVEYQ